MTANLKSLATAALLAAYLLAQNAHAGPVGPLTTFTAGTTAKASEVNGNFSAVSTAVNAHDSRITTLETNPSISGNITLVDPSTATAGNIMKGTASFIHDFGTRNTFIGVAAGNFTLLGGATDNTAVGWNALTNNVGDGSTGTFSSGSANTAIGTQALQSNTTGINNTASGAAALASNTTGIQNTASGVNALSANTTGNGNTASGAAALLNNTTGTTNTASGQGALKSNTTGSDNTASGVNALNGNTTGNSNTASGLGALKSNTTGSNNAAFGFQALTSTTGSNNTAVGASAGSLQTTGSWNIAIGTVGVAGDDHTLRIGNGDSTGPTKDFIVGIRGVTTDATDAVNVVISSAHQLGTINSSRRVKDDIADMGEASSALMKLRPVTFYYKSDRNPKGRTLQYGLVAEEVAGIMPGLVAHSADGKMETIFSQFLAPMLLNEMQKQQREIKAQSALLAKQSAEIAALKQQAERVAGLLDRLERADMRTAAAR